MTNPTSKEITKARATIGKDHPANDYLKLAPIMKDWEGVGWHEADVLYGILIGLQIAEDRQKVKIENANN